MWKLAVRLQRSNCKNLSDPFSKSNKSSLTVNEQANAVLCCPAPVFRDARVISAMPCFDGLNAQHADALVRSCDHDAIVCGQSLLVAVGVEVQP